MKKTVASLALLIAATSAQAMMPGNAQAPLPPKAYCLNHGEDTKGISMVDDCDQKENNQKRKDLELNKYGCAPGQATLVTSKLKIKSCPSFIQL